MLIELGIVTSLWSGIFLPCIWLLWNVKAQVKDQGDEESLKKTNQETISCILNTSKLACFIGIQLFPTLSRGPVTQKSRKTRLLYELQGTPAPETTLRDSWTPDQQRAAQRCWADKQNVQQGLKHTGLVSRKVWVMRISPLLSSYNWHLSHSTIF